MDCIICHKPEIQHHCTGSTTEPRVDARKRKNGRDTEIIARLCGICVQRLISSVGSAHIPWDGDVMTFVKQENVLTEVPILRRRKQHDNKN
ncbi:MAG: hypothetical protein ABID54_08010 [Pseudomonadota bacterium]